MQWWRRRHGPGPGTTVWWFREMINFSAAQCQLFFLLILESGCQDSFPAFSTIQLCDWTNRHPCCCGAQITLVPILQIAKRTKWVHESGTPEEFLPSTSASTTIIFITLDSITSLPAISHPHWQHFLTDLFVSLPSSPASSILNIFLSKPHEGHLVF